MDNQRELSEVQGTKAEELKKVTFLFDVIKRYDHYIATINVKAGLLLSFIAVLIWNVTKSAIESDFTEYLANVMFLLVSFVIFSGVVSAYCLLSSIFPNSTSTSYKRSLIFYGDVSTKYNDKREYVSEIHAASVDDVIEDLAGQAHDLSHILKIKFSKQKQAVNFVKFVMLPSFFIYVFIMLVVG